MFEAESGSGKVYLSWSGDLTDVQSTGQDETIDVNGLFGNKLGWKHGQQVGLHRFFTLGKM